MPSVLSRAICTAAAALFVAAAPTVHAAEKSAAAAKGPRTKDGKPDLNGIWQALNSANYDIEPHAARAAMAMVPGQFVPVPAPQVVALGAVGSVPAGLGIVAGDAIPYTPAALAKKNENQKNWLELDPEVKCYLPGVPRATYMPFPFQILQSQSQFFIAYEYAGALRNIYLKDPGQPPVPSWMGQSVGRWEGETFVVEVRGFNDQTWFDRAGNFHGEALKVTERYTRSGPDHLEYEALIEDPEVFTRPWRIRMPLYRRKDPGMQLLEFKCVEFVEELIYGRWRPKPLP
jgi:hypothetical protein